MYTLIGKSFMDFKGKDGNKVEGVKLFYTYPANPNSSQQQEGTLCDSVFIGSRSSFYNQAEDLCVGDEFDLRYNKYGKVADILIAE